MNLKISPQSNLNKTLYSALPNLPSPSALTYMWNGGSLLGLCLTIQLITGVFLAMHYSCDESLAFESVIRIMREVNFGWLLRMTHANTASFFFIVLYLHMARGLYYGSYHLTKTWLSGVSILFLTMAIAFLGYVLPWGQMSFWGATVITNLLSATPFIGDDLVFWLLGGFSVSNETLTRFFALHFLLPFILVALVLTHLALLHETGSSNPLGVNSNLDKIPFAPYFTLKDLLGVAVFVIFMLSLLSTSPWMLGDPENFIPANSMNTPHHIMPEWYFLFAYAILRSIPSKFGGVMGLVASIAVMYLLPFITNSKFKAVTFSPLRKVAFWLFIVTAILLTWIGARPAVEYYLIMGGY